jgi:hypothetical protein
MTRVKRFQSSVGRRKLGPTPQMNVPGFAGVKKKLGYSP